MAPLVDWQQRIILLSLPDLCLLPTPITDPGLWNVPATSTPYIKRVVSAMYLLILILVAIQLGIYFFLIPGMEWHISLDQCNYVHAIPVESL